MRDEWQSAVGARMTGLKLSSEVRDEVVRELASHFADIYDNARERGAGENESREQALGSVRDWQRFAREVQYEKETLMTTTPFRRQVVYPGLAAMVLSAVALWVTSILHYYGAQYVFETVNPARYFVFNIPWLIALPIAGAAGAWMSWRNGGNAANRATAALFPSFMYLGVILFALCFSIAAQIVVTVFRIPHRGTFLAHGSAFEWTMRILSLLVPWIIAPALSAMVGALPFLWMKRPEAADVQPSGPAHA